MGNLGHTGKEHRMYEIEESVDLPSRYSPNGRPFLYPFDQMEPGQSFFVGDGCGNITSCRRAAYSYGKRTGKKFTSRAVEGGLRVWRVE